MKVCGREGRRGRKEGRDGVCLHVGEEEKDVEEGKVRYK